MVTQARRAGLVSTAVAALFVLSFASACDKVPLLAPSGTVITLFPVSNTVPLNGEVEIVATVIEQGTAPAPTTPSNGTDTGTGNGTTPTTTTTTPTTGAGTPVQNGTVVSFTTTIGRIEPAEARTHNGQVRVKFIAGNQSGTATITAFSGGASGKLENLRVGTAAVERVIVSANPQTLGPNGGTTQIQARVEDASGLAVPGVDVAFTATAGILSPNPARTNEQGIAQTALTTTRESDVTATVAGKTSTALKIALNPRTGISIAGPTGTVSAGQPVAFTINVNAEANIRDVTVQYGDGKRDSLGALSGSTTVQHVYDAADTYKVTATATDAANFTESVSTSVTVLPGQPPGVTITASNSNPSIDEIVLLTANVTGATSTIQAYEWDFGPGASLGPTTTTGNQVRVSWSTPGTKVITVTVKQATGPTGNGQTAVNVRP